MIFIKNGRVIDPARGVDRVEDVLIEDGKITATGEAAGVRAEAAGQTGANADDAQPGRPELTIIDAAGLVVAPGLMDVHVHFRDPGLTYKEDIHTGAEAAAKGGFTTVVCMANTKPPVDNVETLRYVIEEGKKTPIHVLSAATITKGMKGQELVDMDALKAAGAAGFTDDGAPIMDQKLLKAAMEKAAGLNLPLSFHEEDPSFIENNGINRGRASEHLGIGGSPALAEDALVARDCMIALHTGAPVNIQHISSANAVAMVKLIKALGADVTAEVTPHHFTLTEDAVLTHGAMAKMNPPLRTEKDRRAILAGLKDGTIDMIATDHAPHSEAEKSGPVEKTMSGIIGLETALALAVTNLVRPGHLTLLQLMEKMSLNPARLYRLADPVIEAGAAADLVIFDPEEAWTVTEEELRSKSKNTPFLGQKLFGRVKYTICGGKVVYKD